MKEIIIANLKNIEQSHHVKILYACEAGSRAWGLASKSSDYDVRFIYIHPPEFYLSIDPVGTGKKRDFLEIPIQENLDINGWDLIKSLRLLRKSNPSLLEWLHSPIVYYQAFSTIDHIRNLKQNIFDKKTCILHYINMAKSNYHHYQKKNNQDIKMIINVLRPILLAKWLETYGEFPTLNFHKLVEKLIPKSKLESTVNELINIKVNSNQVSTLNLDILLRYAIDETNRLESYANVLTKNHFKSTETLNDLFKKTLEEVWKK